MNIITFDRKRLIGPIIDITPISELSFVLLNFNDILYAASHASYTSQKDTAFFERIVSLVFAIDN
jgi:hypothetical protein